MAFIQRERSALSFFCPEMYKDGMKRFAFAKQFPE